jgi:hypothetical protein
MFKSLFTKLFAPAGVVALALVVAGSVVTPITASAAAPSPDDHWPLWVQGRPQGLDAGDTNGWYVWHDDDGFHVRTTTPSEDGHSFVGVFVTEGRFTDIDKVRFEAADDLRVTDGGHKLIVKFHTHDGMDGVDFRVTGDRLSLKLSEHGSLIGTSHIFVGLTGAHPDDNPFTLHRD